MFAAESVAVTVITFNPSDSAIPFFDQLVVSLQKPPPPRLLTHLTDGRPIIPEAVPAIFKELLLVEKVEAVVGDVIEMGNADAKSGAVEAMRL